MDLSDQRLQICREKIAATNPLLRLTIPYASEEFLPQLIAVHALFSSLDQLVLRATDDYVAQTQLEWWRIETLPENMRHSRHPVVNCLYETGTAGRLAPEAVMAVLDGVRRRLQSKAPADIDEFDQLCRQLYQPRIDIESAVVSGNTFPISSQTAMARQGGFLLLLQDCFKSGTTEESGLWWIPLNLLARNGLSRTDLLGDLNSTSAMALFDDLLVAVDSAHSTGKGDASEPFTGADSHLHLMLLGCLHGRQLARLGRVKPTGWGEELHRFHLADVFQIWRNARKIRATSVT